MGKNSLYLITDPRAGDIHALAGFQGVNWLKTDVLQNRHHKLCIIYAVLSIKKIGLVRFRL